MKLFDAGRHRAVSDTAKPFYVGNSAKLGNSIVALMLTSS
jgi:hypothetical protein